MTGTSERSPARADAALVFVLSALVFVVAHRHGLFSPFVINDDARQQIYWMQRFRDAALYPASLLNDYAAAYVPAGVKALYLTASPFFEALFFSKLLTGLLFCLTAVAFFLIGRTVDGRILGYACAASVWLLPFFLKGISGGLSRSFAPPLLAFFLLAWLRGSRSGMALVLAVQALTIPYMCVLCAASCTLGAAVSRLRRNGPPPFPARPVDLAVLAACAGAVYALNHSLSAAGFGPLATAADMAGNPVFSAAGRLDLYPLPNPFFDLVYTPFEGIGLFLDMGLVPGILSLAAIAAVAALGARRADYGPVLASLRPAAYLVLASLGMYLAARVLALRLFVPDRYVSYSLNMLYALGLAFLFCAALAPVLRRPGGKAGLLLLAMGLGAWRLTDAGLYDYGDQAALFTAARQTPADAVFAGHPEIMDNVLTFGRRNVQASFELAHPWLTGYWRQYEPRLSDLFAAYYASDAQTVRDFASKYGVDYLVVNEADFSREFLAGRPFFAPFDQAIRDLAASVTSRGRGFILLNREAFPGIQVSESVRLIPLRSAPAPGF